MMTNFRTSPGFSVSAAGSRGALLLGDSCSLSSPVAIPASPSRLAAWWHRVCHRSVAFRRYQMCHTVHRGVHVEHRRCTICSPKVIKRSWAIAGSVNPDRCALCRINGLAGSRCGSRGDQRKLYLAIRQSLLAPSGPLFPGRNSALFGPFRDRFCASRVT